MAAKQSIRTYVIGLTEPTDLLHRLRAESLDAVWSPGVNGAALTEEQCQAVATPLFATTGPRSAIGIALAHRRAWETFLESADPYAIIMEDDVVVVPDIVERLRPRLTEMPADTDVLALGCFGCVSRINPFSVAFALLGGVNLRRHRAVDPHIVEPACSLGAHAYLITRKGAQALLDATGGRIANHVDAQIQSLFTTGRIRYYALRDRLATQTSTAAGASPSTNRGSTVPAVLTVPLGYIPLDDGFTADYVWSLAIARLDSQILTVGHAVTAVLAALVVGAGFVGVWRLIVGLVILCLPDLVMGRWIATGMLVGAAAAGAAVGSLNRCR